MKAMILAAGPGTRFQPITNEIPKTLVPVGNTTILGHIMKNLKENGIKDVVITTGAFAQKVKDYVNVNFSDMNIKFVDCEDYAKTNYIYSMWLAKDFIDDDFILIHGDTVFNEELFKRLINSEHKNSVLLNNGMPAPEKDFKAKVENNLVKEIGVNVFGNNCYFFPPIYKISKQSFKIWMKEIGKFVEKGDVKVYAENALNKLYDEILITPIFYQDEFCMEIDNLEDLEIAKRYFNKNA